MSLWTLVPVKPLNRGKSRLSSVLSEDDRTLLNYKLLFNTLQSLSGVPEVHRVLVVSRDPTILSLAREFGFQTLQEDDDASDLNTALKRASVVAQMYGATALLVLPADLPLLNPLTIQAMLKKAGDTPGMVIAPDRHMQGTNAIWISPPDLIEFRFGQGSFARHLEQAKEMGVPCVVVEQPALELDLDLPDDLSMLEKIDPSYAILRTHS
ncbi:MAG TPA: 2-phospho-L-lactate guanylyltransferase [Anaerolinea sp.]|nr:2-phospho-L-lactate guanylyltransferase [Anaerolinea sp.]